MSNDCPRLRIRLGISYRLVLWACRFRDRCSSTDFGFNRTSEKQDKRKLNSIISKCVYSEICLELTSSEKIYEINTRYKKKVRSSCFFYEIRVIWIDKTKNEAWYTQIATRRQFYLILCCGICKYFLICIRYLLSYLLIEASNGSKSGKSTKNLKLYVKMMVWNVLLDIHSLTNDLQTNDGVYNSFYKSFWILNVSLFHPFLIE